MGPERGEGKKKRKKERRRSERGGRWEEEYQGAVGQCRWYVHGPPAKGLTKSERETVDAW